jgi:hypothetical protein
MALLRIALAMGLALVIGGCTSGAPERASDIQNLNGISDDISAVGFTQSNSLHSSDPNKTSVIPHNYETLYTR